MNKNKQNNLLDNNAVLMVISVIGAILIWVRQQFDQTRPAPGY